MPRYENPRIPEGINLSKTHPLMDFAGLIAGVAVIFLSITATLYLLAGWLLPFVPFGIEKMLKNQQTIDPEWRSRSDLVV